MDIDAFDRFMRLTAARSQALAHRSAHRRARYHASAAELTKAFTHQGREAPPYFWRDASGHQVDILIDLGDRLVPVEIRSGITVPADALDGLRWWIGLEGNPAETGVLVHGGVDCRRRDGFVIRPWFLQ